MERFKIMLFTALTVALLQACIPGDRDDWASCGRDVRLQVVDLDMTPDPVTAGARVESFRVNLRSDGSTNCQTRLQIRETQGADLIASERVYRLRSGVNRINIEPESGYRFSRQEHCFVVSANIEGNWRPVDAVRRFCARQISDRRWTLKS